MYKLVIIDDEPLIRQGLRAIIDWSSYDIELCGEADNGIDGLRLCQEQKPDLAIVDIKMPGLNGLQVIEQSKKLGLHIDFIVLSGYSEFAYAQKATEYGVRCYLLKPIEQTEMIQKIKLFREEWKDRYKEKEELKEARSLLMEQKIIQLMTGDSVIGTKEDEKHAAAYLHLPWHSYVILLVDNEGRDMEPGELNGLVGSVRAWLQGSDINGIAFVFRRYICILAEKVNVQDLRDGILAAAQQYGLNLVVTVGEQVDKLLKIKDSFESAYSVMKDKFFMEKTDGFVIAQSRKEPAQSLPSGDALKHFAEEAASAICLGSHADILRIVSSAESWMLSLGWQENQIKASYIALYTEITSILFQMDDKMKAVFPTLQKTVEGIEGKMMLPALRLYIEELLHDLLQQWGKEKKNNNFANIVAYIHTHFASELKLESLAEQFHYNRTYLGKLFKTQTGISFNAYLDQVRIDKAKLLLAGGAKVYEAASLVGYSSVDYFHLKFKKIVGIAPSVYREKWR
ncbi:response regulator transcription factor [Paenibacillus sp. LPE1-1-1.1]|uniref:response regulator transcription factor n=1 Tax=Paenibacillus sp. LPE1-1-1.1 TaxID=3135230 RepID=UPI003431A946